MKFAMRAASSAAGQRAQFSTLPTVPRISDASALCLTEVVDLAIAARRAATATKATTFAERHRAERIAAYEAEYAKWAVWRAAQPKPRVASAADLVKYAAPKPYDLAIVKMKERR